MTKDSHDEEVRRLTDDKDKVESELSRSIRNLQGTIEAKETKIDELKKDIAQIREEQQQDMVSKDGYLAEQLKQKEIVLDTIKNRLTEVETQLR